MVVVDLQKAGQTGSELAAHSGRLRGSSSGSGAGRCPASSCLTRPGGKTSGGGGGGGGGGPGLPHCVRSHLAPFCLSCTVVLAASLEEVRLRGGGGDGGVWWWW